MLGPKARLIISLVFVALAGVGSGVSALSRAFGHTDANARARAGLRSDIQHFNAIVDCQDTSALDRILSGYDRAIDDGDGRWLESHTAFGAVRGICVGDSHAWPALSLALQDSLGAQRDVAEAAGAVRSAWFQRFDGERMSAAIAAFRAAEARYDDVMDGVRDETDVVGHGLDVRVEAVLAGDPARASDYRLFRLIEAITAIGPTLRHARRAGALDTATLEAQLGAVRATMTDLPSSAGGATLQARIHAVEAALCALKQADASERADRYGDASDAFAQLVETLEAVTPRV